ncbi:autotransporter-associated beta strand repeat-containing protein [Ideonella sp. 4Y11]|uniref:Autotransporter-associated beta strand repeat-containing protein n=1 Tax=Ideonella aquatica TaxID=2824119 RepID=A0A940YJW6_9BURK|nr:MBG domain-containing protein [Ideonella aquatica]MBQ0960879.1 autotransporter-associated beta strand repeat-containing protein [Ideonella aquatica]
MTLAALMALGGWPPIAQAQVLPSGGSVVRGQARIGTPSGQSLTIQQGSARAVIDWSRFDIGAGAQVNVVQPGSGAALLNRVSSQAPSTLAGQLTANGQVFLVNPNGIAITPTGTVQVGGGFVASTLDIGNDDFMAGRLQFAGDTGVVTHAGRIDTGDGGFAVLLGQRVDNSGSLVVPLGRVGLGAGRRVTLDLQGDGFLQVGLPANPLSDDPVVNHRGRIQADGGRVQISVASARQAVRQVVNLSGVVEARSVSGRSGAIVLGGGDAVVAVSGRLDTSSSQGQGGQITVTGGDITLQGATLDASGASGGGSIRIGGDWHGGGTLQRAQSTTLDATTTLKADATASGDGGDVVVWADGRTAFAGRISARGAGATGNGGEAEVSGRTQLSYTGQTDLRAAEHTRSGRTGHLLLDPYDVTISSAADTGAGFSAGADDTVINTTTLQNALATASVTVSTGSGGTQSGQITVASPLSWSANTTLTLDAAAGVAVNAGITHSGAGSGLVLQAAGSAGITGSGALANGGTLSFNQNHAGANSTYAGDITGTGSVSKAGAGALSLGGSNSYSGTTSVQAGTLQLTGSGSLGTGSIGIGSGATLLFNTSAYNNSGALLSNSISGAGTLQIAGAAATQLVRLSGDLSGLTGAFQVDVGARANLHGSSLGSASANFVVDGLLATLTTGATYQFGSLAGSGTVSQGGGTTNTVLEIGANGQSTTFSGNIGNCCDSTSLTKLGTGTWSLTGTMTYTGTTTISAGTLQVGAGGTSGALNSSNIINNAALVYKRSDAISIGNAISGSGSLTQSGSGTLTLTGSNSYSGSTTIAAGTLQVGAGSTTGTLGTGAVTNNGTLSVNRSNALTVANAISGTGALTKSGAGTLTLTGANSYSGGSTLSAGTVVLGSGTGTLGSGTITLAGGNLALNPGSTSATYTYANPIHVTANGTIASDDGVSVLSGAVSIASGTTLKIGTAGWAGKTLTLSGDVSGAGALTIQGNGLTADGYATSTNGVVTLSGTNGYSGATAVTSGTLKAGSTGAFSAASAVTTSSGVVLDLAGYANSMGSLSGWGTLTNNGAAAATLTMGGNNASTTFAGVMQDGSAAFALTKTGSGTLALSGTNTFTGLTTISAGTLQLGDGGSFGKLGTGQVLNNGVLAFNRTVSLTVPNAISGTGSLTKATSNTITLTGANSYSGTTTVSAGTLQVGAGGTSGTLGTGAVTVDGTLAFSRSDALSVSSHIGGSGALTKAGAGTLTLTGTNTYSGTTTISAGTLQVGAGGTSGTLGSGSVTNSGTLVFNRSDALTVAAAISGTGALTQAGSGTLSLSGASTYSGATTINQGALKIIGSGWLGAGTYSGLAVASGSSFEYSSSATQTLSSISGAGTVTHSGGGTLTLSGTPSFTGIYNLNGPTTLSGAGNLAKSGLGYASAVNIGGYVTLAGGNNSFLGYQGGASATTVVTLNAGGTLYNPGATMHLTNGITFNGGTLASGAANSTFAAYGSYTFDNAVYVTANSTASALSLALNSGSAVDMVVSPGATLTVSGTIDRPTFGGGADLRLQGGGTLVLQQANSFTGMTWVDAGTLRLGHAGALAASSAVTVNGTLDLSGHAAAVSSLAGSGTVTNSAASAATLTAGSSGASTTFSGVIQDGSGSVALTKAGSGTLTLSGALSHSGATTVDGGTLALSGSWDRHGATATVAVASGATLSGAGTLSASTLQVSGAGTIDLSGSNVVDQLSTSGTVGALSFSNAASLSVGAINSTGPITLSTTGASADLTLGQSLHSDASGDAVVLAAGGRFINQAGASALTTGTGGRFLVYSNDWEADTVGGLSAGHLYNRSYANDAPGTITQAGSQFIYRRQPLLTVTALDASRVYGDANPAFSISVSGVVNGDNVAAAYAGQAAVSTLADAGVGVGSYAITPGAGTLASSLGYGFSYVPGTLSVTPRALTVSALASSRVYGNANPSLGYIVGGLGLVNGDTLSGALGSNATTASHVGTYAITQGTLVASPNYTLSYTGNALTVTPRAITVMAHAQTRTYGDANPALGYTVGGLGLVNGDTLSGALATSATAASNVGSYAITQGTLAASPNYTLSYTANHLAVTPRAITVLADAQTRAYGDANPALSYSVGGLGLVNGDTLSGSLATAADSATHVGRYGISQGTLAASPNYLLSYSSNELVVTPRVITVAADAHSRYQGDPNPPLTYSVGGAGLVNGDRLSGALSTMAGTQALPGSYAIELGTLGASADYQLSYAPATMTVRALPTPRLANARTVQVSSLDCAAATDLPSAERACGTSR